MRKLLLRFLRTEFGRFLFGLVLVLLFWWPAFVWRYWGAIVMSAALFSFIGGYYYARWEWRRRGYVPKFDDPLPDEPINARSDYRGLRKRG
jgi:O-antigen/teichoic acid export membrane protein